MRAALGARWTGQARSASGEDAAGVGIGIANSSPDANAGNQEAQTERGDDAGENESGANEEAEGADSEEAVIGSDGEKAAAAALAYTDAQYAPGGTVTEMEFGDDGAAYGVEVMLTDGRQVEVHLDADFAVTGDEGDDD